MTSLTPSPREELKATISEALYGIAVRPGASALDMAAQGHPIRLSGNERDEGVRLVLNAIKRAGGVVLMPRDANAKRAWGEITEIPGAYVNVLEADP